MTRLVELGGGWRLEEPQRDDRDESAHEVSPHCAYCCEWNCCTPPGANGEED